LKSAIILQHADFEGPGRIETLLDVAGYGIEIRRLHRGDAVPLGMDQRALLVVMGGSMGVADIGRPEFPFLVDEVRLLRRRVDDDAPVLGICLGAQLLAHAGGARVYPMAQRSGARAALEVGWSSVRLHHEVGDDSLVGLPPEASVLHWHGDMFEVPVGARLLASSQVCPHQAFRLKRHLFGLQFHCEAERGHVEAFLREDRDFVVRARGVGGVDEIRRETELYLEPSRAVGDVFLENILRALSSGTDRPEPPPPR
jgi:GMP synthase (glutamine-hydrolysing)